MVIIEYVVGIILDEVDLWRLCLLVYVSDATPVLRRHVLVLLHEVAHPLARPVVVTLSETHRQVLLRAHPITIDVVSICLIPEVKEIGLDLPLDGHEVVINCENVLKSSRHVHLRERALEVHVADEPTDLGLLFVLLFLQGLRREHVKAEQVL